MGLSSGLSCEIGSFSCCCNPDRFFLGRGFEALFPCAGTQGCMVCLTPQLFLLAYLCVNVHQLLPGYPSCPSLPLLPVWMSPSSLSLWLSDFHAVWFSGSSGCFLFLNLLLSFFWLCEEVNHFYLHLILAVQITKITERNERSSHCVTTASVAKVLST